MFDGQGLGWGGQGSGLAVKDCVLVAKDRQRKSSMAKRRCFGKKKHNILFYYAFLLKECELTKRMAGWPGDPVLSIMC